MLDTAVYALAASLDPCSSGQAAQQPRATLSESSSASGWNAGPAALAEEAASWPASLGVMGGLGGDHSLRSGSQPAPAGQHAVGSQQQQQQGWGQACGLQPPAAGFGPAPSQAPLASLMDMQLVAGSSAASDQQEPFQHQQHHQQQQGLAFGPQPTAPPPPPQQQPLAEATASLAIALDDPWCSGLEMVAGEEGLGPMPLTDAGLEALLAPFEDWPALLPPAGSSAGMPAVAQAPPAAQQALQQPDLLISSAPAPAAKSPAAAPAGSPACSGSAGPASPAPRSAGRGSGSDKGNSSGGAGGKAPRRKGGRPRVHHPRTPHSPPAAAAATSSGDDGAAAAASAPAGEPAKKSGRGPKPKYVFSTQEEAADARRERNRKAALESYYRKKEHVQRLQAEIADLQWENGALQGLLGSMGSSGLCPLLEASDEGIDMWLRAHKGLPPAAPV